MLKKICISLLCFLSLTNGFVGLANSSEDSDTEKGKISFPDLSDAHWAKSSVDNLVEKGVISGNPDGTFRPDYSINRAEFLKIVLLAVDPDAFSSAEGSCFNDVDSGYWYTDYVCSAKKVGIVEGYPDGTFRPASYITRAEAVALVVKALDLALSSNPWTEFADVTENWQKLYVQSAVAYGVVKGYSKTVFGPLNNLTRAEAAKILDNALNIDKNFVPEYGNPPANISSGEGTISDSSLSSGDTPAGSVAVSSGTIIVDHTTVDLDSIPETFIQRAKQNFRIAYGHTSHGSQILTGMEVLENEYGSLYAFGDSGTTGELYINDDIVWGDLGDGYSNSWADLTRSDVLSSNSNNINVVMWSWCGGASDADEAGIQAYLDTMGKLSRDYPNVTFVYMTGHLDGSGESGNLQRRNEQIRQHVRNNGGVLFDFADIESYNPDGVNYLMQGGTDGMDYNDWADNWAEEWCSANPGSDLCVSNSCAHSHSLNCNLKARAFWWMMARMAGWSGVAGDTTVSSGLGGVSGGSSSSGSTTTADSGSDTGSGGDVSESSEETGSTSGTSGNSGQGTTSSTPAFDYVPAGTASTCDSPLPTSGNIYYVSPSGSDSASGSLSSPLRTPNAALELANSGDTVVLRAGTYTSEVRIRESNIALRSYPGERAVIHSTSTDSATIILDVDSDYSKIQCLEITGGFYAIMLWTRWEWGDPADRTGTSNIVIEDNIIHGTGRDAIKVTPGCDNVTIRRNEIYDTGNFQTADSCNAEGIDNVNGDNFLVQNNYIHDVCSTGVYCKGGSTNCIVENNVIENPGSAGILLGFDTSPEYFDLSANPGWYENIDGIARNNLIINPGGSGIGLYASKNAQVYNNTIVNAATKYHSPIYFGVTFQDWEPEAGRPANVNPTVRDNVVVQGSGYPNTMVDIRFANELGGLSGLDGALVMSGNCYYAEGGMIRFQDGREEPDLLMTGLSAWQNHISSDSGSLFLNPALNSDYEVTASGCVGRGYVN